MTAPCAGKTQDIKRHFAAVGTVRLVKLAHDAETGRSKGFAYVDYATAAQTAAAVARLHNSVLQGRKLTVVGCERRRKSRSKHSSSSSAASDGGSASEAGGEAPRRAHDLGERDGGGGGSGGSSTAFDEAVTLEDLRARLAAFAAERDWDQFHQPRNLVLALVGEVGELAELFQWRGDHGAPPGLAGWSDADHVHLGEELSDVLLYLLRLADRCGVDLPTAALRKLKKNAEKYPAAEARGSSAKYTAYAQRAGGEAGVDQHAADNGASVSDSEPQAPASNRWNWFGVAVSVVAGAAIVGGAAALKLRRLP